MCDTSVNLGTGYSYSCEGPVMKEVFEVVVYHDDQPGAVFLFERDAGDDVMFITETSEPMADSSESVVGKTTSLSRCALEWLRTLYTNQED